MKKKKKIDIINNLNNLNKLLLEQKNNNIIIINIKIIKNQLRNIEIEIKNKKNGKTVSNLILENQENLEEFLKELMEIIYQYINKYDLSISEKVYLLKRINDLVSILNNLETKNYLIKGILSLKINLYEEKNKIIIKYEGKINNHKFNVVGEDINLIFPDDINKFKILYDIN